MSRTMRGLGFVLALSALAVTARISLRAQPQPTAGTPTRATISVQDALHEPFKFTFAKPTRLEDVARQLGKSLNAPVAIDRAAIERQGLKPDDEVQLELEGVRLKTGLKLLLDQLDLTFKVVPEDNLLVITDSTGSADPTERILDEIKALHRDIHDLQDAVDEVRTALGIDDQGGHRMHKPTIIEEMPAEAGEKPAPKSKEAPAETKPGRSRPGI
jgi:hypothetical protein